MLQSSNQKEYHLDNVNERAMKRFQFDLQIGRYEGMLQFRIETVEQRDMIRESLLDLGYRIIPKETLFILSEDGKCFIGKCIYFIVISTATKKFWFIRRLKLDDEFEKRFKLPEYFDEE